MVLHGWLNVDKPAGITSYGVIARLKRLTGQRHIGHAGTLDPLATGILPIAFGQAARTIEFLHQVSKTYIAEIRLGIETDTLDAEGTIVYETDASHIDRSAVENGLKPFIGNIQQVPPMYSALKRNGTPLYELARRGETVEIKPRMVTIYRLDLIDCTPPSVTISVECGSGTYIRSIARDLGQTLGVGAHLKSLRRTRYGEFNLNDSICLEALVSAEKVVAHLLPNDYSVRHCPKYVLTFAEAGKIIHGIITNELLALLTEKNAYRLYAPGGDLMAIIDVTTDEPRLKVFNQTGVDS